MEKKVRGTLAFFAIFAQFFLFGFILLNYLNLSGNTKNDLKSCQFLHNLIERLENASEKFDFRR